MANLQIDEETLQIFLEEAREHLSDIETELVAIESDGSSKIDSELVNKVFRGIHSIKGGAGFFGLERLKTLAHTLENILNRVRNEELVPTRSVVSAMLKAADVLTGMIADPKTSNDVDITAPLEALKAIEQPSSALPQIRELQSKEGKTIFRIAEADIERAIKGGKFLYILEYDLIADIEAKERTPWQLFNELEKTGFLMETALLLESDGTIEASSEHLPFFALFATVLDEELMRDFSELPTDRVHRVIAPKTMTRLPAAIAPPPAPPVVPTAPAAPESKSQMEHDTASDDSVTSIVSAQSPSSAPVTATTATIASSQAPAKATASQAPGSLRVNVKVLDTLMSLASELVLARNQLMQKVASNEISEIHASSQSLSLIISELQEAVMSTRMQPLSTVFGKFHRIVRDLSQELGKDIQLEIEGEDVELDKTVVESISDPLTHLIRNSVDHGIEMPEERRKAGKSRTASVKLNAYREAGKVVIEIADDGRGINLEAVKRKALENGLFDQAQLDSMSQTEIVNIIFLPGFSTATKVTDISGRGVGMDVVRTNLTKLGGVIDIDTHPGLGSTFRVKLPLTLAIIPSLLVSVGHESYAIPQVNLVELVRVPAAEVRNRIERIGEALVMRLRGRLLPLLRLSDVLGIEETGFQHPETGEERPNRRQQIEDRRAPLESETAEERERRTGKDRRFRSQSAISVAVLSAGEFQYGLIVDKLHESEEIVVKPLGHHFSKCECYAGATILGDGKVALILDVVGVMRFMKLSEVSNSANIEKLEAERNANRLARGDIQSFLLFRGSEREQFAVPLSLVSRIELIEADRLEFNGGKRAIQYRGGSLPILTLDQVAHVGAVPEQSSYFVIVFATNGKEIGLLVSQIVDVQEAGSDFDEITFRQPGVLGSSIMSGATTLLVDLYEVVKIAAPEWITAPRTRGDQKIKVLIADDSPFYLRQISKFAGDAGFEVVQAHDGREALDVLEREGGSIDAVLTDVEMPNMDGLEFTRKVRAANRWPELPIIAITSLSGEEAVRKGMDAGVDRYIVKLDREKIIQAVEDVLAAKGK